MLSKELDELLTRTGPTPPWAGPSAVTGSLLSSPKSFLNPTVPV